MRYLATFSVAILAGLMTVVVAPSARSEIKAVKVESPTVKVSLAVPEGYETTKSPLHVIIENISDKRQEHFEEWNSWGYGNLTVEWTDENGKTGTVAKVPGSWDRNGPGTVGLEPGQALVREVTFDPKLWQGWPTLSHGAKLTLKVTYKSAGDKKAPGWAGEVRSKAVVVMVR